MKKSTINVRFYPRLFKGIFLLMTIATLMVLFFFSSDLGSGDQSFAMFLRNQSSAGGLLSSAVSRLSSFIIGGETEFADIVTALPSDSQLTKCSFIKLNPFEPSVVRHSGLDLKTLTCDSGLPDLTYIKGNQLILNQTKVKERFPSYHVTCKYQDVVRRDNRDASFAYSEFKSLFTDSTKLPPDAEFILVVCEGTPSVNSSDMSGTSVKLNLSAVTTSSTVKFNTSAGSIKPTLGGPSVRSIKPQESSPPISASPTSAPPAPKIVSRTYLPLIPKLDALSELESMRMQKRSAEVSPLETMNVIMMGFDGVSRYHFLRSMNKTYNLLVNDFHSFDMSMYSQIGINTFPNFLGLLTGQSESEARRWYHYMRNTDEFDLIWKDYEKAGYRTLFSEDHPKLGAFNFGKSGFYKPPTSYYSKTIGFAIEQDKDAWRAGRHCIGNQPEVSFYFNYLRRFLDAFPRKKPLFALVYSTRICHDYVHMLRGVDDHVHRFYADLGRSGHLNNTLLITFSDHGIRFGPIRYSVNGDLENRTPYAIFTLPSWFLKKYPEVAANLKANTERLVTHYDTHATLQDLLYFRGSGEIPLRKSKHGISLFKEIPRNRTCADAFITDEFCVCNDRYLDKLDASVKVSKFLAENVVSSINARIDKKLCHNLTLQKVVEVTRIKMADRNSKAGTIIFKVKVETAPGAAVFESIVHAADISGGKPWSQMTTAHLRNVTAGVEVDRLNMYRGQSDCVDDVKMKLFCYCNNLIKT